MGNGLKVSDEEDGLFQARKKWNKEMDEAKGGSKRCKISIK